jgi:ASPIC and UnbV
VKSNRAGVGARLTLTLRGVPRDSALRMREVTSGGSFGANSFMQHIGLGRATGIGRLEIFWPASGIRQVLRDVPINRTFVIREGDDSLSLGAPSPPERGRGSG